VPSESPPISARTEVVAAFRSLRQPPFLSLLLLSLLLVLVSTSIAAQVRPRATEAALFLASTSSVVLAVLGVYLQIAVVLAAGGTGGPRAADPWMRAAFKHRCFWRYLAATILEVFLGLTGFLGLVVGAWVVGGIVGLTQAAVVLERRQPGDALRRSAELTKPARGQVGTVFFALLLVPAAGVALQVARVDLAMSWNVVITVTQALGSFVAAIALTRIFVKLGGAPTPPVQVLLYKASGARPR
jgi:hypothetical protein